MRASCIFDIRSQQETSDRSVPASALHGSRYIDADDLSTVVLADWENDPHSPWQHESRALYYAGQRTRGQLGIEELDCSIAERFGDLVKDGSLWSVSTIRRAGASFEQRDLVSDDEIIAQIHGRQTSNAVITSSAHRPAFARHGANFAARFVAS